MKRLLSLTCCFVLALTVIFSFGCGSKNDDNKKFTVNEYKFTNYYAYCQMSSQNYKLYFNSNATSVPYISIKDFVSMINGFYYSDLLDENISEKKTEYKLSWQNYLGTKTFVANWKDNTIKVNTFDFFYNLINVSTNQYIETDTIKSSEETPITFDLGKYDFEIYYYKGEVLAPLCVLNTLFCSLNQYNIYFNGDALIGVNWYINQLDETNYNLVKNSSVSGKDCPKDLRVATLNHTYFLLDYFYGLKEYRNIKNGKSMLSKDEVNGFLSTNFSEYSKAYIDFFQKDLDELHSILMDWSFYSNSDEHPETAKDENMGAFRYAYCKRLKEKNEEKDLRFTDGVPLVRYNSKTAIIYLNEFDYKSLENIVNAISQIKSSGNNIENIILDISTNGGGSVDAMISVLGCLTNEPIELSYWNYLSNSFITEYKNVDADMDRSFSDNDAYVEYNWYVMTSLNSYSCANAFASVVKDMGFAKLIGKQSGGGMCSVFPFELCDGTSLRLSSHIAIKTLKIENDKNVFYPVEAGIPVDYEIDEQYFYDDDYLSNFVENL